VPQAFGTENPVDRIIPLFPEVPAPAWEQLRAMAALHREWNAKVNLVSRKDIDALEWHHYAPSIATIRMLKLMKGARVMDIGTGGGFPGLILAVLYPQAEFTLVDSVGKKIACVQDIVVRLGLRNVDVRNARAETLRHEHDYVTGRAVSSLPEFIANTKQLVHRGERNSLPNGILYWQGGDPAAEFAGIGIKPSHTLELQPLLSGDEKFFEKRIVLYRAQDLVRAKKPPTLEQNRG
jgi:16S rRNA (guanine527-N7)-methyltransferase